MGEYLFQDRVFETERASPGYRGVADKAARCGPRPRVLMVGMHLSKTRGGISTLTEAILNSDLSRDHDFTYIASQAEDFGKVRKVMLAMTAAARFAVACAVQAPNLVYIHIGSNASLYRESAFILLAKLFRRPVVSHFHAGDMENYYPGQPALGKWFIRKALGSSDRILPVSQISARQLRALMPSAEVSVLPNAIDTSIFDSSHHASGRNTDGNTIRVLFVGAVGKLKGELDLIKALAALSAGTPAIKASFIGYNAESLAGPCARFGISHLVEHLGPVPLSERASFFEQADIFVLPTYAEAMPVSVIEAMAAGLAIISTPVGGIPDLIEDGEEGLLVPSGDVKGLTEKLEILMRDKKARMRMGKKARQKACKQLDIADYVAKLRREMAGVGKKEGESVTTTSLFLKRSIKSAAAVVRAATGLRRTMPGGVNIIAYHRVVSDITKAERDAIYGIVISAATFRQHCEMLRRAYDVVSLEAATSALDKQGRHGRPLAVITFDDGYRDFYDEAFPILDELGLPATVFLPTAYIGQDRPLAHDRIFWLLKQAFAKPVAVADALRRAGMEPGLAAPADLLKLTDRLVYLPNALREKVIAELERELADEILPYPAEYQLLNWDMVREMSRKGITFGAHTANHVVLPLENESVIKTEIIQSKNALENQIGEKALSFAYPNGEYNAAIRQVTADAGFKVAVTTDNRINRPGSDPFALGRTSLCEESTRGFWGGYSQGVADLRLGI